MENWRKLSLHYHQIPSLSVPLCFEYPKNHRILDSRKNCCIILQLEQYGLLYTYASKRCWLSLNGKKCRPRSDNFFCSSLIWIYIVCPDLFFCVPRPVSLRYSQNQIFEPRHDKANKVRVCPGKTQISLGIRPVWSESSLSAWRNLGPLATYWAHSEDPDQTGQMPRLIWVLAGHTLTLLVLSYHGSFYLYHQLAFINRVILDEWSFRTKILKQVDCRFYKFHINDWVSDCVSCDSFKRIFADS